MQEPGERFKDRLEEKHAIMKDASDAKPLGENLTSRKRKCSLEPPEKDTEIESPTLSISNRPQRLKLLSFSRP